MFTCTLLSCYLCVLLVACVVPAESSTDPIAAPLCSEVHGFADDIHSVLTIPLDNQIVTNESIVFSAQALSTRYGGASCQASPLQISADYPLMNGTHNTLTSSVNALLLLTDAVMGSNISVHVQHTNASAGLVPFSFYSFYVNRPVCFVSVDASHPFDCRVPTFVPQQSGTGDTWHTPVTLYFSTTLPPNISAAILRITVDSHEGDTFRLLSSRTPSTNEVYNSGETIHSALPGGTLFSRTPRICTSMSSPTPR